MLKASEGEVIGTAEDVGGQTSDTRYDLFFTATKVIAAIVLHPSDLLQLYSKRAGLEELVIGGAPRRREVQALSMSLKNERRQGFKNKTPNEILSTHRANLEIRYENILSVRVSKGLFGTKLELDAYVANGIRKKFKFQLHAAQSESVRKLFNLTLPDKLVG
jgi:hypothetical protein